MFEDEIDLEGFYGMPSAGALGVLVQILVANGKASTAHDLLDYFSDGIHDLRQIVDELRLLGLLDVTEMLVNGTETARLDITIPGHAYLSQFAWELINNYESYFSD